MTVSECRSEDVPELVASAGALFAEDGGRHDPFMDTGWPAREGTACYADLVDAFLAWARARGANEMTVQAYAQNDSALAFYRARGFRPFQVTLTRT